MVQADLSGIEFFLPLLSFLVVLIISYFLIHSSKLISSKLVSAFVSFIIATVFVSAAGPRNFILVIIPWFAVVIVGMFFILALNGFLGKDMGFPGKYMGVVFVGILGVVFFISALFVFSSYFSPYLPWSYGAGGNPDALVFLSWLYSPRIAGALLLLGLGGVVSWILVKAK